MGIFNFKLNICLICVGDDNGSSGKDDDDEPTPSCGDYVMHFLTVFWKIIFAFIPPTGKKISFENSFVKYS